MKQSQLKSLVKEIVQQTFKEMHDGHSVDGDNMVTIEGVQLPDGRLVDVNFGIEGVWDDGAFDYEYSSIKGTHSYGAQFELQKFWIETVVDRATNQPVQVTPDLQRLLHAEMESIQDAVETQINENPPENEPDYPEPDDR
jgi:DUF917 family protein